MIIHFGTTVNTVFAEVDEEGNVVKKHPLNLELSKLDTETFAELVKILDKTKQELKEKVVC